MYSKIEIIRVQLSQSKVKVLLTSWIAVRAGPLLEILQQASFTLE